MPSFRTGNVGGGLDAGLKPYTDDKMRTHDGLKIESTTRGKGRKKS